MYSSFKYFYRFISKYYPPYMLLQASVHSAVKISALPFSDPCRALTMEDGSGLHGSEITLLVECYNHRFGLKFAR